MEVAKSKVNYNTFGVLYNWLTAIESCPYGWHLQSQEEWTVLTDFLYLIGYGQGGTGDDIVKSMASATLWWESSESRAIGNDLSINNSSGFNALPAGYHFPGTGFQRLGFDTNLWTSTPYPPRHEAWYYNLH